MIGIRGVADASPELDADDTRLSMARMKRMTPAARSARREARAANPKALRPMIGGELASTQQLEEMMDAPSAWSWSTETLLEK